LSPAAEPASDDRQVPEFPGVRENQEVRMISIVSLWLPVVLSAVFVFLLSWLIHMLLPWHRGDFRKLPSEDEVADSLRRFSIPPGDYMLPCGTGPESMKDPKFKEKFEKGPVVILTVRKPGPLNMGSHLLQWFIYCAIVSVFAAYVAGRSQGEGAHYLAVFRFAGVTAFVGYSLALWQDSIWHGRSWSTTMRSTVDGLVYGLVTAGTFGWLWPR
jgi:hypothetical protein